MRSCAVAYYPLLFVSVVHVHVHQFHAYRVYIRVYPLLLLFPFFSSFFSLFLQNSIIFLPFVIVHLCSALHTLFAFSFLYFSLFVGTHFHSRICQPTTTFLFVKFFCGCACSRNSPTGWSVNAEHSTLTNVPALSL